MKKNCLPADRTEATSQDGAKERKQVKVPGAVHEPGTGDYRRNAIAPLSPHGNLGFGLGRLVDVCWTKRHLFVCRCFSRCAEYTCGAAMNEPRKPRSFLASREENVHSLYMGAPIFRLGDAGNEQAPSEVIDDIDAIER